jgi:hypothetical protein
MEKDLNKWMNKYVCLDFAMDLSCSPNTTFIRHFDKGYRLKLVDYNTDMHTIGLSKYYFVLQDRDKMCFFLMTNIIPFQLDVIYTMAQRKKELDKSKRILVK